jgi:hypothetical protein
MQSIAFNPCIFPTCRTIRNYRIVLNCKFNGVQSGIVNFTYQPSMKTFGVEFN